MLRILTCLFAAAAVLAAEETKTMIGEQSYRVYRSDGSAASFDDVVRASDAATVTFLGETHDDPVAHYLQEQILRAAHRADLALSLEMFETDVQYVVDEYLAGLITEEHLMAAGRAWRNYKSDYRPMVEFAKEHHIPVIAANAPRRYVNRVSRLGAAKLEELGPQARRFLPPLPYGAASPEYAAKFHKQMEEMRLEQERRGETARRLDPVKGLEAQSLWDAGMAFSIADFLTRNPDKRVVHCNGSFHTAQRLGIVDHLARYRPGTSMLVVTIVAAESFPAFDEEEMRGEGDFVIVTDPAHRERQAQ